jgi:hemoglobin
MSSGTSKPTLYERLGGVHSIAAVVDDFIDRVMHNPVLNANAAVDEAHHRVSAAGFKYYVTEMVCWATGGPQNYTGRSMSESHKHLKITESEWAAFCKDFDDTMAKFNVPEAEHKELFAIVESTKATLSADRSLCDDSRLPLQGVLQRFLPGRRRWRARSWSHGTLDGPRSATRHKRCRFLQT